MSGRLHRLAPFALAGSIVLSTAGQLGMKAGMQELHGELSAQGQALTLAGLQGSLSWTIVGLVAYGCSMVSWLVALTRFRLSVAYPLLGLSYVCVYVAATFWPRLAEPATPLRTLGTLLILAGVTFVSYERASAEESRSAGKAP
jgi:undecaprenyl phosphate-alpha-L-ara4N flippase subunit ArnF